MTFSCSSLSCRSRSRTWFSIVFLASSWSRKRFSISCRRCSNAGAGAAAAPGMGGKGDGAAPIGRGAGGIPFGLLIGGKGAAIGGGGGAALLVGGGGGTGFAEREKGG